MADQELIALLKKIPWFESLNPEYVERLAGIAVLRHVRAGETLFREGDKEDYFYVVLLGRIALEIFVPHKGKMRISTCEQHEAFGWSSVTPVVHQRTAGATAVIDSSVIGFEAEKLRQLCDEDHSLGYRVYRRLANVVASRLLVTRLQLLDMFADPEDKKNA